MCLLDIVAMLSVSSTKPQRFQPEQADGGIAPHFSGQQGNRLEKPETRPAPFFRALFPCPIELTDVWVYFWCNSNNTTHIVIRSVSKGHYTDSGKTGYVQKIWDEWDVDIGGCT